MKWLLELQTTLPIAHAVLVLAGVAILGLAVGSLKVRQLGLGIAGVLFAGILFGHFKLTINKEILHFVREFGLILFVYTIGMQVGPGFLTSLRRQGLPLNLMAASIVLLGALVAVAIALLARIDMATIVGVFSGATTNTPSLGASQEALKSIPNIDPARTELPALGYAVAYPFGVIGIILTMLLFRGVFRIDLEREAAAFKAEHRKADEKVGRMNIRVENPNLEGVKLKQVPGINELGVVVSRIKRGAQGAVEVALEDAVIHVGDLLLAVGKKPSLEQFRMVVGKESSLDLLKEASPIMTQRIVVTKRDVLGKSLRELEFNKLYSIAITRVTRADLQITAVPELELQFGDMLMVVGEKEDILEATKALGNSVKELQHTNLIPVFVGILLGILLGSYPFTFGGMPAPVRLGLAGGPLLAALILSRIGRLGPLVWYMPVNANIVLRELGIVLFLACVGLKAGEHFADILTKGDGFVWMGYGALITVVPLAVVGVVARLVMKQNFMNVCGLMAGSMTDPPALQFANATSNSDAPSVAYATVYPLTMFLRILVAQILVLVFCR
ncbi:MAG: putative transporter [Verrucomicrobia bacterium]|nr:putative transporter [Verrucomicrobiota bacterium]